eukprot:TRINITY_DN7976_c0_g1_i1.p2 TRINITY_DN7976_c0_g1~~TRINITY_DN7976_c0_g1_i1.p2  ORF type:complete len:250 (-),score=63.64 TRINITY_DN7976_c0_g1_i1:1165-1914(-)
MCEHTANPGPLGLFAFGVTTTLLNFQNAHVVPNTGSGAVILATGMAFGGLSQVIAGILEYCAGHTFPCVAFVSYGAFWLSYVAINLLVLAGIAAPDQGSLAAYLGMWGLFTFCMFLGTVRLQLNRAMQLLFITLAILFWLLTLGNALYAWKAPDAGKVIIYIAGVEGIFVGLLAVYMATMDIMELPRMLWIIMPDEIERLRKGKFPFEHNQHHEHSDESSEVHLESVASSSVDLHPELHTEEDDHEHHH